MLATVAVGGSLELGAADEQGRFYVNVEDRNEIAVIDTRPRKVVAREPLPGCDGPTGMVYHSATGRRCRLVPTASPSSLPQQASRVASLPMGKRPDGAVFDARRHVALMPSGADGTLIVIEFSPARVIATVATAKSARTIALDPSTGRAYLPRADLQPAACQESVQSPCRDLPHPCRRALTLRLMEPVAVTLPVGAAWTMCTRSSASPR